MGAGLAGIPGAGRLGIDGPGPGGAEPPGLLGRGGGGARPGFGDGGRLKIQSERNVLRHHTSESIGKRCNRSLKN